MHPLGCYGSSLAFAPETSVCQACDRQSECSALVEARRPDVLRLLSKFTDSSGEIMAFHWLTPDEKKKVRKGRKAKALAEVEAQVYGDRSIVMGLKASLDKRVHPLLDRMTKARINIKRDRLEAIGGFSEAMGIIVSALRVQPRTMKELTDILATECNLTQSTAQRDAYALVSILCVSDRANRSDATVELK